MYVYISINYKQLKTNFLKCLLHVHTFLNFVFSYSLEDGDAVDQEEERVVKKFRMGK